MIKEVMGDAEDRMRKAVDALEHDLRAIRTGRASPALLDRITVDYYGAPTPVNQLATISAPEARMLMIKPWDQSSLRSIERAILESDLGLNPSNDGKVIRLVLPQLTEERRRDLVKQVQKRLEEARVAIRNVRRDALSDLQDFQKEGEISEDELYRARDRMQELTDRYIAEVDQVGKAKEDEILEV
ncbi:MAG: ribosome recycling factor [Ardenticatenaceae bacterium]|nr:ribosome recycling factor [Ardenticatenaceae bacterium]HBY94563.1 ribosome recycling factor [Chloroflexota bacterium]